MNTIRSAYYTELEAGMLRYRDYIDIPVKPSSEPLIPLEESARLTLAIREDARPITGEQIFVRQGVVDRLDIAKGLLFAIRPGLQLQVGYGYRALSVQAARFTEYQAKLADQYQGLDLLDAVHRLVAMPEVAGHPAGAAVDIQLSQNGQPLDFGTKMWEFVPESYAKTLGVSADAAANRRCLRQIMLASGFAPFDGEWWHFSYGDKEWAKYYNQSAAIYDQVEFRAAGLATV